MSVAVQSMSRYSSHDEHVAAHKLSTSQADFIGSKQGNNPNNVSHPHHKPAVASSKQTQRRPILRNQKTSYDKYARTKQRGDKTNKRPSSRTADVENRDPETIRRLSVKYASSPVTPVAPPTTPVSTCRFDPRSNSPDTLPLDPEIPGLERSESRQSKYHEDCQPRIDPANVIGSRTRRQQLYSARSSDSPRRRRPSSLASTSSSLLSHRESVVNVVYAGIEGFSAETSETQWIRLPSTKRRASTVFAKMASLTPHPDDVAHGDYDVMQEDDYSLGRWSRNRSCSSINTATSFDNFPSRSGFLYQIVGFDNLSNSVPHFVKNNVQKNGRLVTESFILKVNYLRRRRALGDLNNANNNNKANQGKRGPQKGLSDSKDKSANKGEHQGGSDHPL